MELTWELTDWLYCGHKIEVPRVYLSLRLISGACLLGRPYRGGLWSSANTGRPHETSGTQGSVGLYSGGICGTTATASVYWLCQRKIQFNVAALVIGGWDAVHVLWASMFDICFIRHTQVPVINCGYEGRILCFLRTLSIFWVTVVWNFRGLGSCVQFVRHSLKFLYNCVYDCWFTNSVSYSMVWVCLCSVSTPNIICPLMSILAIIGRERRILLSCHLITVYSTEVLP